EPEPEPVAPEAPKKQSLLKKEIGFKRKPKPPKEPKRKREKRPKQPKEAKAKQPLLKKELSFRRKPKAPKETAPKARAPKRLVGLKIGASQLAAARVAN